jgi:NitT/TauT family transport system substrate-binding protein
MPANLRRRHLLAGGAALPLLAAPPTARAQPQRVRLLLDWAFQSPNAFALVARERGYFREAGLEVQVDRGTGGGAVPPALVQGTHEMAYADINPTVRFLTQNPEAGLVAVCVLHDRSPMCAVARADGPIRAPADFAGRRVAAPDFDSARQLFPAFARANGIELGRVGFLSVTPALREPMLVRREADAITGFVTTSALALKSIGLDHPAQRVFMYYEHGLDLYGGSIITTRRFLESHPAAVRGVVAALLRGFRDTLANPAGMIQVLRQVEPLTDGPLELERHQLNVARVIVTDNVRQNGLSSVSVAKLQAGLEVVEDTFGSPRRLRAEQVYTDAFLPPASERRI